MLTGVVVFLCAVLAVLLIFFGYLIGVRYGTMKLGEAQINAMFDCGVDSTTVRRVIAKTKQYLNKELEK